jgi:lipid A ethanolaminephosphotransferase
MAMAPKEQYQIPFIVWTSNADKKIKDVQVVDQHYVFHSVLNFLDIQSPAYKEERNIFID